MENLKLRLIGIITHCPDVKTFRFELKKDVAFKPGQYLIFTLNVGGKDISKALSISNSPTEKGYIQFTKKLSGSDFSRVLSQCVIGQEYALRLPMGKFTFEGEHAKAVFLSGGIGITPIRSIFKYATDKQLPSSLVLLYSSRTPEYLIFRDDFTRMQESNRNLKIIYTLTQCQENIPGCLSGYIDGGLIKQEVPDFNERVFFICGPPNMVDSMRNMLISQLSIAANKIVIEDFIGY
jgi:ferredoxin-NADP reductase